VIEELLQQLIERLDNRYYGKHRGFVSDVKDPLSLGRLRAYVPRLLGETQTGWAMPCAAYAGPDQGLYAVPDVGAGVWVEFEGGDLSRPIWSGTWWGQPGAEDINQSDSTARAAPETSEIPKEHYPERVVDPQVRMLKTTTGHYILFDDRKETARVEIRDATGNRIILSSKGIQFLANNEAWLSEGNRGAEVDGNDTLRVGGDQTHEVHGARSCDVDGSVRLHAKGEYSEAFDAAGYTRSIDANGVAEAFTGPHSMNVRGSFTRRVSGAVSDTAMGGFGLTSGGNVQVAAAKSFKVAAAMADVPSLNAVSIDALLGNISINSMLGMCQLGGMSAISPMVLGDGLAIHFTMLAQILKAVNPLTAVAYGPLLDAWAAMTPLMDWSLFGFVKRFPFGP
jgi:Type VI secretion system/phage-baseplate injector OB domain